MSDISLEVSFFNRRPPPTGNPKCPGIREQSLQSFHWWPHRGQSRTAPCVRFCRQPKALTGAAGWQAATSSQRLAPAGYPQQSQCWAPLPHRQGPEHRAYTAPTMSKQMCQPPVTPPPPGVGKQMRVHPPAAAADENAVFWQSAGSPPAPAQQTVMFCRLTRGWLIDSASAV